jgi:hypothetical protein
MKFLISFILICLSLPVFANVKAVPLSRSAKAALLRIYDVTRNKADCCGISRVLVFKVESGRATSSDIQQALELASLVDKDIEYAFKSELFESRNNILSMPEFVAFYGLSGFTEKNLANDVSILVNDVVKHTGKGFIQTILSADIQPAPNVDGTVDVGVNDTESVIVIRVNDFGA